MRTKIRIGILLSGSGTNFQAILDAVKDGLDVEIVQVVSSRPDAYGITRAKQAHIPVLVMNKDLYANPIEADTLIVDSLKKAQVDYVVMAGYMRKVTPVMLDAFPHKVINLHPALLPSFKGAHAIEDAFNAGVKVTGITIHFANEEYDRGPIIAQSPIEVKEDDTLESLEERIHAEEHKLYPHVLQMLAEGRVHVQDDLRVAID